MALTKYTNVDDINSRNTGTGQFLEKQDLFIISQNSSEVIKFGGCTTDVMEVTLYDVNNNILPHLDGKNVKYIKYPDINLYLLNTNTDEIAINVEKLLNDSGYKTGIIKVNINFVRKKAGDETDFKKMWIQEISATRSEIRILPLVVQENKEITKENFEDFINLQSLNVDTNTYKQHLINISNKSNTEIQNIVQRYITSELKNLAEVPYTEFAYLLNEFFGLNYDDVYGAPLNHLQKFIVNVSESFKEKIVEKINNFDANECSYANTKELEKEIFNYLIQSFNSEGQKIREIIATNPKFWTTFDIATDTEQLSEITFETNSNIQTNLVTQEVQEYSTIDLSSVTLNSSNLDNFELLQKQLNERLSGVTITDNTTPTDNTDIRQTRTYTLKDDILTIENSELSGGSGGTSVNVITDPYNPDYVFNPDSNLGGGR